MSTDTGLRLVAVIAFATAGLLAVPGTRAESGESLDEVLDTIEWGDSKDEVLEKLKSQMFEAMRQRADVQHNQVKLQEVRKRMVDKFETIKDSYTELEGEKTGYEVSVISGEYTKNNDEAVLVVEDDAATRYYFFVDEQLFKMVVAYRQSYLEGVAFETFVGQTAQKYGEPGGTTRREIGGERKLASATWKDSATLLRAKNQRELFGTFTLVFSDRKRIEKMQANDREIGGSDKDGTQVSERVEALKRDSGKDENADVVDGMLGEKVEVDISHREEKELDEQGPSGEASETKEEKRQEQKEDETGTESGGAEGTQANQESSEPSDQDDEQDRDFSNLSSEEKQQEEDEDDELIIY